MAGVVACRDFECVFCADGAYAQGFQAQAKIFGRAGGGSEVEDVIYRSRIEGLADVALLEAEAGFVGQVGEVIRIAGGEIVDADYSVALAQQAVGEVRTKETGGAGNKYVHVQNSMLRNSKYSYAKMR